MNALTATKGKLLKTTKVVSRVISNYVWQFGFQIFSYNNPNLDENGITS